jgi:uncharacterized damage-inducible protein DinB
MHLDELNEYDYWANTQILKTLESHQPTSDVSDMYHHILEANRLWYSRLIGHPTNGSIWNDKYEEHLFQKRIDDNYTNLKDYLNSKNSSDLAANIQYSTLKSDSFSNKIGDILFHIFNHSTHHRAQIMSLWRQLNIDRPSLDYIFYKRK